MIPLALYNKRCLTAKVRRTKWKQVDQWSMRQHRSRRRRRWNGTASVERLESATSSKTAAAQHDASERTEIRNGNGPYAALTSAATLLRRRRRRVVVYGARTIQTVCPLFPFHCTSTVMANAMQRKADAFVTKLAHSLASSATDAAPTQSAISANFEQTAHALPSSKLRSHILDNLPSYTTQLLQLYTNQLPTSPPTPAALFTSEAFDAALSRLQGDVRSDIAICESLLICSNCPSTVVSTYFRLYLSAVPTTPLPLSALHRALSFHSRASALVAALHACVEWAEGQLTQQPSPCNWLSSAIDRLTSLCVMHCRAVRSPSAADASAVLSRLCRLLLLGVVWRGESSSVSAYVAHATRALAVFEQPSSAVNVDAQLLLLCQWCALLHAAGDEQQASAAVSSSAWLAVPRLPTVLAAVLPGIVRALPLCSATNRSIACVRLAILHSILPSSSSDQLTSHLQPVASLPLPSALVSLWPTDGQAGRGGVQPSVEQWVRRAHQVVGEATLLQQLMALGAVGSEAGQGTALEAVVSAARGEDAEGEESTAAYGWIDDRRGDASHDALDGQLHSLIADLRKHSSKDADVEQEVDSAVSELLHEAGEDQPSAAEQQAAAQQDEEEGDEGADDEQQVLSAGASTDEAEKANGSGVDDAQQSLEEAGVHIADKLPPPAPTTRPSRSNKARKTSVRVSPRHTRSGMKL